MGTRYFVKFIGDKNVTLAKAQTLVDVQTLRRNQFEETTHSFYQWIRQNTLNIEDRKRQRQSVVSILL